MQCKKCNQEIEDNIKFCPCCGASQDAPEEQPKGKKHKNIGIWIALSVVVILAVGAVFVEFGMPYIQNYQEYQGAQQLLKDGKYEEAKKEFLLLGAFKDSVKQAKNCDYAHAEALFAKKDYEQAKQYYAENEDYKNSAEQMLACDYGMAEDYKAKKEYEKAEQIYKQLGDYKDCKEKSQSCNYAIAGQYVEQKKYEDAGKIYKNLGEYKDSQKNYKNCRYAIAEQYMDDSRYEKAKAVYAELGKYKDAKEKIAKCETMQENQEAIRAYCEFLEENDPENVFNDDNQGRFLQYWFYDIDGDGIVEMFVSADEGAVAGHFYIYKDGEVKLLHYLSRGGFSLYKTAGIICAHYNPGGGEYEEYYTLSDGTMKLMASKTEKWNMGGTKYIYIIGERKVKKKEFEQYLDGLIGSEEPSYDYVDNTYANREAELEDLE